MMNRLFVKTNPSDLPKKFDIVVEAVRRSTDGRIQTARIFERRGPTWSDRLLIDRDDLIQRLKAGEKSGCGYTQRIPRQHLRH